MLPVSVVIICKNEADIIGRTIHSVQALTDDVVVVDSGSTDGTIAVIEAAGATLVRSEWEGFGPTKNKGIAAARHNWILSIDADEQPDQTLIDSLHQVNLSDTHAVYNLKFKTYLGRKLVRYGEWGTDAHIRFFNRSTIRWNEATVHEQLVLPPGTSRKTLNGFIHHYSMKDLADYTTKMTQYALLSGEHYYQSGKRAGWIKRYLSPAFSFYRNYLFKLGFLDGREGYLIARVTAYYTMLKYARLDELNRKTP
ncbi:glycosyltransferase family 2 protein [Segetibacter sp. 3557_3]|uniref:glycosyltransferase family 2 protein n=1 Tax=Segetibacter sp. 3557_3 TaxID=2547429 RepID=UPI001058FB9D|nr:glycosyltransferase family 2 protein [Segetibacter sp. 3557_3]TDH20885.1 glycosyltransferase family 2 protein [Segetibacter sp. 3557_3]